MATAFSRRKKSTTAPRPSTSIERATLDCTVWVCEPNGLKCEVIYVAETPGEAKAFAAGFNARPNWDCLDMDHAEAGVQVLERMIDPDGHYDPEAHAPETAAMACVR